MKTYLDSSVLIAFVQGEKEVSQAAARIIDDPKRVIILSEAVKLEVMPLRIREQKRESERKILQEIFATAGEVVRDFGQAIWEKALEQCVNYNMSPMDALHVAAAIAVGTQQLVTAEGPSKGLCKTKDIEVLSLRELDRVASLH